MIKVIADGLEIWEYIKTCPIDKTGEAFWSSCGF
jgi:hypothetical protein